jgi:hypothetical protein
VVYGTGEEHMSDKIKVVVGQVWLYGASSFEYLITRIDFCVVFHRENGREQLFGALDPDGYGIWAQGPNSWRLKESLTVPLSSLTVKASGVAINDHTCPTCSNTHCSKTERTCWKCGNNL